MAGRGEPEPREEESRPAVQSGWAAALLSTFLLQLVPGEWMGTLLRFPPAWDRPQGLLLALLKCLCNSV